MLLRGRLFSLAFLSFLIFSPLSSVINLNFAIEDEYTYSTDVLGELEPEVIAPVNLEIAPPPWTCFDTNGIKASFLNADPNKCAPRSIFNWDVGFGFGSEDLTGTTYQVLFQWKYLESGIATLVNATWDGGTNQYIATGTFIYPANGTLCTYELRARLRINGGNCNNSDAVIAESLVIWDDISAISLGTHDINHDNTSAGVEVLGEIVEVCRGDDSAVRLLDSSTFNCSAAVEPTPNNENRKSRWVQWVYGTAGTTVTDDVIVNGVTYTSAQWPIYGTPTQQPVFAPDPAPTPAPNALTDDIQMPTTAIVGQFFEVTIRSFNTCNPFSTNDDLSPPQGGAANNVFEINGVGGALGTEQVGLNTITGGVTFYANDAPITRTYDIEIVAQPLPPVAIPNTVCNGVVLPNFQITAPAANVAVEWYEDNAGVIDFSSLIPNSLPADPNSLQLLASDYEGVGSNNPGITNTSAAVYTVWARYSSNTGSQDCWSEPVSTSLTIRELLVVPGVITGTTNICDGSNNVAFTLPAPAGSGTPGGVAEYEWSVTGGGGVTLSSTTAQNITININVGGTFTQVNRTIRVRRKYADDSPTCYTAFSTFPITIFGQTDIGSIAGDDDICENDEVSVSILWTGIHTLISWEIDDNLGGGFVAYPAGGINNPMTPPSSSLAPGTYNFRAVIDNGPCNSVVSSAVLITVNPIPPKPTVSASGAVSFCEDSNVTLTSSNVGLLAASYQWYESGVAVAGEVGQTILLTNVVQSGSYTVEVIGVAPTACTSAISDPTVVTINTLPTADVTGGGSICGGGSTPAPDVVFTFTGVGPWDLIYAMDGVPQPVVSNTGSPFNIVGPTGNPAGIVYTIVSVTDNNTPTCTIPPPAGNVTGSATVTVIATPPPTVETFTATLAVCDDGVGTNPPDAILDLLPDSPQTYDISYTINGVPFTATILSDAAGIVTLSPPYTAWGSVPGSYVVTVTALKNTVTLCAGAVPFNSDPLIVNPRPADATNPVNNISCVTGAGVGLNVDAPPAGNIIHWYADMALTIEATTLGVVSGVQDETFTPTSSATATFYAVAESTTAPTNCQSLNAVAVIQSEDQQPSPANAENSTAIGVPPAIVGTCDDTFLLNANVANNLGTGTWTASNVAITFDNVNDEATTARTIPLGTHTFTWTITTALGVCLISSDNYDVTRHALPAAIDPSPDLCEDTFASTDATVTPAFLLTLDATVNGGNPLHTVEYFSLATRLPADLIGANFLVSTNDKVYTRVTRTDVVPQCTLDGEVTFTVDPRPVANSQVYLVCEESVGSANVDNQNLPVLFNDDVIGNPPVAPADRTVVWYYDPGAPIIIAEDLLAFPGSIVPGGAANESGIVDGQIFYALVTDITPANSNCLNFATIEYDVVPRPIVNPIVGQATVCVSGSTILYQVTNVIAGTQYNWVLPPNSPQFQLFGGGGVNDFFVLLQFPSLTAPPASDIWNISVTETSPGPDFCLGDPQNFVITVEDSPSPNPILGPDPVCEQENGVVFQVTNNNPANTYSWSISAGDAAIVGASSGVGLNQVILDFNAAALVTLEVIETSPSGCSLPAAQTLDINALPPPVMTSAFNYSLCSGEAPATAPVPFVFTAAPGANTFAWEAVSIPGSVSGVILNETGVGDIVNVLTNTSGLDAIVTFEVTPTGVAVPNCVGAIQTVFVTVQPEPILVVGQTTNACGGSAIGYEILLTPANLPALTVFNWPDPDGVGGPASGGVNVPMGAAGTTHINDIIPNISGAPINITYVITPTSGSGCDGPVQSVVVTVDPQPVIAAAQSKTICSGSGVDYHVSLLPAGLPANTEYDWAAPTMSAGGPQGAAGVNVPEANALTLTDVLTNTTGANITATYSITPTVTTGANCTTLPAVDVVITIEPEPVIAAGQTKTICSGSAINYHVNLLPAGLPANTEFDWPLPAMSDASLQGSVGVNVPEANALTLTDILVNTTGANITATYSITPVVNGGLNCTVLAPVDVVIIIEPQPVIVAAQTKTICSGVGVDYDVILLPAGLPLNTVFSWPVPIMSAGPAQGTAGVNVPESNVLTITDVLTNTTGAPITATYSLTPIVGSGLNCTTLPAVDVVITVDPAPVILAGQIKTICSGDQVDLEVLMAPINAPAGTVFNWALPTMSDASVQGSTGVNLAADPAGTLHITDVLVNTTGTPITATYNITPTGPAASNCFGAQVAVVITVDPVPVITVGQVKTICSGDQVDLEVLMTPINAPAGTVLNWGIPTMSAGPVQGSAGVNVAADPAGTLHLTDVLVNTTGAPITATYNITPTGPAAGNCLGAQVAVVITIDPAPVITAGQVKTICSGDQVDLEVLMAPINAPAGTVLNWGIPTMSAGPVQGSAGVNVAADPAGTLHITDVLVNTTGAPITATYNITPTGPAAGNCLGAQVAVIITVDPAPVITAGQVKTICSGDQVDLEVLMAPINAPAGTVLNWGIPTMSAGPVQGSAGVNVAADPAGTLHLTDVLVNTTGAPITATYNITPTGPAAGNCLGAQVAVVITVDPAPVIVAGQVKTICSGDQVDMEVLMAPINAPAGTVLNWGIPTMSAGPAQGSAGVNVAADPAGTLHITDVLVNTTGAPITATYNITPTGPATSNCLGAQVAVVITVDPAPVIIVGQIKTICSGDQVDLEVLMAPINAPAGTVLNWGIPTMSAGPVQGSAGVNVAADPAGTLHLTDVLVNTTGVPITATYNITPTGPAAGNCLGAQVAVIITVDPAPVITAGQVKTICSGDQVDLEILMTPINTPAGTVLNWALPTMSDASLQGSTGVNVAADPAGTLHLTDVLTNTTGVPITATYNITPTGPAAGNCLGAQVAVVITVNPAPLLIGVQNKTICSGDNVGYEILLSPLNQPAGTVFNWPDPDAGGPASGGINVPMGAAGTLHITDVLLNTTGAPIIISYQVTPTSGASCVGAMIPVDITIDPAPVITAGQIKTICSGDQVDLEVLMTPANAPAGTLYNWPDPDGAGPASGGTNIAADPIGTLHLSDALTNTTGAPIIVTYQITPSGPAPTSCVGAQVDIVITVNPEPVLVAVQNTTICSGDNVSYEILLTPANLPAGTVFNWPDPDAGGPASAGVNVAMGGAGTTHIMDVLTNTTGVPIVVSYQVTPTSGAGCTGTMVPVNVTVNPEPVLVAVQNKTICSGDNVAYEILLAPLNLPLATVFNWPDPDGPGPASAGVNVAMGASGTLHITDVLLNTSGASTLVNYQITPSSGAGCVGAMVTVGITIDPEPVLVLVQTKTICSGNNVDYEILLTPANLPAGTVFNWPDPDGAGPATNGTNVPMGAAGTFHITDLLTNTTGAAFVVSYQVTPTSGVGCIGTLVPIDITVAPEPVIIAGQIKTICSGDQVDIEVLMTPANLPAATLYNWPDPDGVAGPASSGVNVPADPAGTLHITDILTNFTGVPFNVTYQITPTGSAPTSCPGTQVDIVITVDPEPVMISAAAETICSSNAPTILLASNVVGTNFNWVVTNVNNVTGTNVADMGSDLTTELLINMSGLAGSVTYDVTPTGPLPGSCVGAIQTVTITVDPEPVMSSLNAETICSGASPTIVLVSNVPGSTFNWVVASVSNVTGTIPGNTGNDLTTEVLTNISGAAGFVTYNVTANGPTALTCPGPTQIVTITVDPAPIMTSANAETICSGNTPSINFTANVVGSTFDWIVTSVVNISGGTFVGKSGSVDLSGELLTNFNAVSGTATYQVTPRGPIGLGCFGIPQIVTITVDPGPAGVADAEMECSNVPLNYDIQADNINNGGNNVVGQFTYTVSEITASGIALEPDVVAPTVVPITFNYINTTAIPAIVRYTITPIGFGGCAAGAPFDVDFTINPEPVINPLAITICSQIPLTITPTLTNFANSDVDLTWTVSNITGAVSGINVGDTEITDPFAHILTNTSSAPAVITYSFIAAETINNSCVSSTQDILVTVNPEPVGTPTVVTTVCSDELFSLTLDAFVPNLAGNNYTWTVNYNGLAGTGPGAGTLIAEAITNVTSGTVNVVYTVTPTSLGGTCTGTAFDITVPISAEPKLDPLLSPLPVCSGVPSGIILGVDPGIPSVPATSYDIVSITFDPALVPSGGNASIGNGQAANVLANDTYTNTTNVQKLATYDVVPVTAAGCKGDLVSIVFRLDPAPALSTNLNVIVCNDAVNGIVLSTTGTSTPVANYRIVAINAPGLTADPGNAEPTLGPLPIVSANVNVIGTDRYNNPTNGILTATYSIVPISGPGCDGPSVDVIMTVEPDIIAAPVSLNATICSNDMTDITLISPTSPSAGVVSFNVQTSVISGTASGFIPFLSSLPENFQFTDVLVNSGNVDATVRYQITPIASAAASNNSCIGTPVNIDVVVEPLPQVTPGQFVQVCSGTALNYTISNLNGLVGTMFKWATAPTVTGGITGGTARPAASTAPISDTFVNTTGFRQTASYTVTPVGPSANACEGTPVIITINIDPLPVGTIAVDNPVVCMNGSAILSFTMTVGVAPFEIVYGNGTTDFTVSNIANSHFIAQSNLTATTTYTLKSILDVNGCSQNIAGQSVVVTVENPIASFTADITNDCTPLLVTFTNNDIQAGTQYEWNFGDGSPNEITNSPTIAHNFINNSTLSDISFNVVLTAQRTNGTVVCTQTATSFVTIKAGVNLAVSTLTTEGCSPLLVTFENNSQGVLTNKWFWRLKGTTDENDVTNTFFASFVLSNTTTATQTIEVVYQGDRNGCNDEVVTEIEVYPEVVADFDVAPGNNIDILPDPTITVTNNTINKNSWTHLWEWGDGDTTTDVDPPPHTYAIFGQFELKLTVSDPSGNCVSEQIEVIIVNPILPEVDFSVDITEGCRALTVNFTNLSTSVDPNTWMWEFRNERNVLVATSNLENPTITFFDAGRINVSLSGSNPLGVTDIETKLALIEIYELPTASFTVTPDIVFLPDQLLFTSNLSGLADAFEWDFNGDGDIDSEEFEPSFKYESAGVYDVSLVAINTATGCSDTVGIEKAVKVIEGGTADIPNGFFPGSGNNPGGPGGSPGAPNSVFLPRTKGVRDDGFEMQIFDRWGHLIFESKDKAFGWDGRDQRGKLYPMGVYVYKLDLVYVSGQQTTILGDVTLIR